MQSSRKRQGKTVKEKPSGKSPKEKRKTEFPCLKAQGSKLLENCIFFAIQACGAKILKTRLGIGRAPLLSKKYEFSDLSVQSSKLPEN